jgi:hypothetical protein
MFARKLVKRPSEICQLLMIGNKEKVKAYRGKEKKTNPLGKW